MFTDFCRTLFVFSLIVLANFTVLPLFNYDYSPLFLIVFLVSQYFQKNYATVACLVFIILGLSGLPCFSFGAGLSYLKEPSFTYIISLIPFSIYGFVNKSNKPLFSFVVLHLSANLLLLVFRQFSAIKFIDFSLMQMSFDLMLAYAAMQMIKLFHNESTPTNSN